MPIKWGFQKHKKQMKSRRRTKISREEHLYQLAEECAKLMSERCAELKRLHLNYRRTTKGLIPMTEEEVFNVIINIENIE